MTSPDQKAQAVAANPYGFIDDPAPGSPFAWYAGLCLALWLAASLIAIVRAMLLRKQLVRARAERSGDGRSPPAERSNAKTFDRMLVFLDRTVFLSPIFGVLAALLLVRRTLQKIGAAGQVEFATVAGPWSEAMEPLLFSLGISLLAGLASALLYLPEAHTNRSEQEYQ